MKNNTQGQEDCCLMLCDTVKSGTELWAIQKNRFCVSWYSGIEDPLHEIQKYKLSIKKKKLMSVSYTHARRNERTKRERRGDEVFGKLWVQHFVKFRDYCICLTFLSCYLLTSIPTGSANKTC